MYIKVAFPMAEGLIKVLRCFSPWKAFLWNSYIIRSGSSSNKSFVNSPTPSAASRRLLDAVSRFLCLQDSSRMALEHSPKLRADNRIWKQWISPILLPQFFNKYVLRACYVADTIVNTEDTALNKNAHRLSGKVPLSPFFRRRTKIQRDGGNCLRLHHS